MTIALEDLLFAAPMVAIDAAGGIPPQVVMIAYTGGLMTVPGWGPVVIDLAGLNLGERQIGILADHDSTLKGIVGYGFPMVVNHKLMMHGSISTSTDTGQRIIELAKSGFPFQASVGIAPDKVLRLRESENVQVNGRLVKAPHGGLTLVRTSALREVSIVAIGADSQTSVTISASQGESVNCRSGTLGEGNDPAQCSIAAASQEVAGDVPDESGRRTVRQFAGVDLGCWLALSWSEAFWLRRGCLTYLACSIGLV